MWKVIKYKFNERLIRIFTVFFVLFALCGIAASLYNNLPLLVTAVFTLVFTSTFSAAMALYSFSTQYGVNAKNGPRVDEDILKLPASPSDKFFGCILGAQSPAIVAFLVAMLMIAVRAAFGGESLKYEPNDIDGMLMFVSIGAYFFAMASVILYSQLGRNKYALGLALFGIYLPYPLVSLGRKLLKDIDVPLSIYVAFWIVCLASAIYLTRKAYKRFKTFELLAA
ncbi:MAG: hypothetical protein II951_02515 [Bacteroidales bacterium]|nr:hypothetical protein [Bacteroidales bacterium]